VLSFPAATSYTNLYNVLNFPAGVVPVSTVTRADEEELQHYRGHYGDPWDKRLKEVSRERAEVFAEGYDWHSDTSDTLPQGLSASPDESGSLFSSAVCIHHVTSWHVVQLGWCTSAWQLSPCMSSLVFSSYTVKRQCCLLCLPRCSGALT